MLYKILVLISAVFNQFLLPSNVYAKSNTNSEILVEMNSGRIIHENNSNERKLIASITKIMTAILTIENATLNETVRVGKEILKMYGTNIYLQEDELITVEDLLYGLMLRSGNDAAIVLATYIGGTEEKFVDLMNKKAKEIGMENTTFQNSHGLDDYNENYSSAYDMSLLSTYAYKNAIYRKIAATPKYNTKTSKKSYSWTNRNKLISQYKYCTGGKNGYTPKAGKTLVTTAENNKMALTVVSLNIPDEYNYHKSLYSEAFKKYKMYKIVDKNKFKVPGKENLSITKSFYYPLTPNEKNNISTEIIIYPKKESNIAGHINVNLQNKKIGMIEIYEIDQKKEDISIFLKLKNYLFESLKKFILGRQNSLKPGPLVPTPPEI